jgi:hypothetical protein
MVLRLARNLLLVLQVWINFLGRMEQVVVILHRVFLLLTIFLTYLRLRTLMRLHNRLQTCWGHLLWLNQLLLEDLRLKKVQLLLAG